MRQISVKLPETLYRRKFFLSSELGESLNQYIIYSLTQQTSLPYYIKARSQEEIEQDRKEFHELIKNSPRLSQKALMQKLNKIRE
ncbi:hypothetical protein MHK_008011 [Candidatus Magnetomorum sp. HK-1]|nr:hypothetical protein MHK_008011 [Candidatus Magnetomorum sp. HK-1]